MTVGTQYRNAARKAINLFGNTVGLTPLTDSFGPRDANSPSAGVTTNVTAVTSANFVPRILRQAAGNETAGDLMVWVRDDATVTQKYRVTHNSVNYLIDQIQDHIVNDVVVMRVLTCFKEL